MIINNLRWLLPIAIYLLVVTGLSHADTHFPSLTGRVVDNAGMLDRTLEQRLTSMLEGHENATTNQVVIVTVTKLDGNVIEAYAYQLGRHWGIGQAGKDNGVLFIVAKKERKVRIEVGYGLEGTLTDAISSNIINSVILPEFKKARFGNGIEQGATAIIQALGGQYEMKKSSSGSGLSIFDIVRIIVLFIFLCIAAYSLIGNGGGRGRGGGGGRSGYYGSGHGGFGGGGSFGGGGGGFSGGGGGFGGGGASGGW